MARSAIEVAYGSVGRSAYAAAPNGDRAWCGRFERGQWWCVVGESSQRGLLELILGGPGATTRTAVEHTIIAEFVERLLAVTPCGHAREEHCARPASRSTWRCNVDLTRRGSWCATLQLFAECNDVAVPPGVQPDLSRIPLVVTAAFSGIRTTLQELPHWRPGSLVPLGWTLPRVMLATGAGRRALAAGEWGRSGQARCIRISEVAGRAS